MFLISNLIYYLRLFVFKRRFWMLETCPTWFTSFIYGTVFDSYKCIWCRHSFAHVGEPREDWTCSTSCEMLYRAYGPRDLLPRNEQGGIMIPPISEMGEWKRQSKKNN